MPAQGIVLQTIPRHTVMAFEAIAHIRGSGCQIDSDGCSPSRTTQTPSRTRTNRSSASTSNPLPTSMPRPPCSTGADALPAARAVARARSDGSAASNALLPAGASRSRRLRYRPSVLNASPRSQQNSLRLNPLGGTVRFRKRWPTVPDEPIGSPSGRRFWDVVRRTPSVSRARKKVPSGACPTGLGTRNALGS